MNITRSQPKTSHLFLLLAFGLFAGSLGPVCVRFALGYDLPPDIITTIRMGFTAIIVTPIILTKYHRDIRKMQTRHVIFGLFGGSMFGLQIVLIVTSLENVSIMISQVMVATSPIWVALLEVTILKTKLSRYVWAGIIIAFAGGAFIAISTSGEPATIEGGNAPLGIVLSLFSAVCAAFYLIMGRKVRVDVPFVPYIWLVYIGGATTSFIISLVNQSQFTGYDPRGYLWVIALAIVAQIIAHGSFNFVLGYIAATTVSVSGQSVPILSTIWGFLLFSEVPTILQIVGSLVIIIGVTIVIRGQNKSKRTNLSPDT